MKNSCLLLIALSLLLMGCSKQHNAKKLLTKTWTFSETPQKNMNSYQGNTEDRTILDGTESITFKDDGTFLVNHVKYGSWNYNKKSSVISIVQTPDQAYSCCGISETKMEWQILKIKKDELVVKHSYYKYDNNQYNLK